MANTEGGGPFPITDEWAFAPVTADDLRDDLVQLRRACKTWKAIAVEGIHSLAASYNRIAVLERHVQEMREERDRYARSVWPDAAMREQR